MGLAIVAATTSAADDRATIGRNGAALFPYAGFFESDKPIVCMLAPGTHFEKLGDAPLRGEGGAVIAERYFVNVRIADGDCEGRTGWITASNIVR